MSRISKWEWAGFVTLAAALAAVLKISWRKWPDPIVDFGRELYLPWRLSEGAVLYRDMDANYGPLSHYFNALVFRVFGPGLMHLVAVNLVIYAAILALVYGLVREGWGRLAAFLCSMFFIVVFSFSQFVGIGNYNFATPYSHETTHGFLLVLVLIALCASWLRGPRAWKAALAGLVCGLCALLKVEILFAAGLVVLCAIARAAATLPGWRGARAWLVAAGAFSGACIVPPLVATGVLWSTGAWTLRQAFDWANIGWLGLFLYKDIAGDPIQATFLGTANFAENLRQIVVIGGLSVAAIGAACVACRFANSQRGATIVGIALIAAIVAVAKLDIRWTEIGIVFPAWLFVAVWLASQTAPGATTTANMRWLMLLAAFGFLARMAFNPRVYHYGYCQAALAGIITVATILCVLPDRVGLQSWGRAIYTAGVAALLAVTMWNLGRISTYAMSLRTQPVGEGADRFYGFAPSSGTPAASYVEDVRKRLAAAPDCRSVLVMPEGIMLNYLLRKPSPTHVYMFNPYWLNWRDSVLDDLKRHPPDRVVLVSRDLSEYGVGRFGESPEHGATLMQWTQWHYAPEWQRDGDPLDPKQQGISILKKIQN